MPWVRLDDGFPDHPKVAALGPWAPLGVYLYVRALAYANKQLTDGRIAWGYLPQLASFHQIGIGRLRTVTVEQVAERLIEVGLWERPGPLHIQIHDYACYQPSKAAVLAERLAKATAGRRGGIASGITRAQAAQAKIEAKGQADTQAESKPVPVPLVRTPSISPPESSAGNGPVRTPTPTEARRMAHDRNLVSEKPWRARCRARGHDPMCQTPTACELLEVRRDD